MSLGNKWIRTLPVAFLLLSFALVQRNGAYAATTSVNLTGVFQLDANAQTCPGSTGVQTLKDWDTAIATAIAQVVPGYVAPTCTFSGTPKTPTAQDFVHDGVGGAGDFTIFTGGTSKDNCEISTAPDNPCSGTWGWSPTAGVQDKDDLTNVYAAAYSVLNGANNDLVLTFGSDRFAQKGDSQQSFWFTQNKIGLQGTGTDANGNPTCNISSGCPFTGIHKFGDLLVQVNFTQGGAVGGVSVFQWIGSNGTGPTGCTVVGTALCQLYPAAGQTATPVCGTVDTTSTGVCAIVNTASITSPWPYTPKAGPSGSIPGAGFMEGAIDLSYFFSKFGESNPCISTYTAETRSSQSTTSTTSDFATGSFPLCTAGVTIDAGNINPVGVPHTFTINATQTVSGVSGPASSASLTASIDGTRSTASPAAIYAGSSLPAGVSCANFPASPPQSAGPTTTTTGSTPVTVLSCKPGTVYVNVSGTVTPNGDGPIPVSFNAQTGTTACPTNCGVKTYADGYVVISPLTATNLSGTLHTLTATVYKTTSATGPYTLAVGSTVTFSLLNNNNGASIQSSPPNPCTTGSNGQCSISINSTSVGSVDIQASALFDSTVIPGLSQTFTRTTGTTDNSQNSVNANKLYVNGRIYLTPSAPTNPVGSPEAFTIHVQKATSQTGGSPNWVTAPAGMTVSYSIVANADSSPTPGDASFVPNTTTGPSCPVTPYSTSGTGTTDSNGTLTVTVLSCTAGKITVHASTSFDSSVFPGLPTAQTFTRATGGTTNTALGDSTTCGDGTSNCFNDAVKTYKSGSIRVEKTVELGQFTPAPNICFTITTVAPSTVLIVNGAVIAQDGTANELCFSGWTPASGTSGVSLPHTYMWSGLASGTYRVVENTPAFPYNQNPPDVPYDSSTNGYATGIAVDAINGTFPIDLTPNAPWTNPLVKGALDVQKNFNGVIEPVTGTQFSFTITQCSAGSVGTIGGGGACTATATTYALTVPGCNWDVTAGAQPTTCNPLVNPVRVSGLTEGYYKIAENAKSGFSIDPTVYVVQVFAGNNLSGGAGVPLTTFNNVQRFRVVAFACDMLSPSSLHPASVTLATGDARGTETGTTLSGTDLSNWNSAEGTSVTQDQLCHLEGSPSTDDGRTNQGGNFPGLAPTTSSYAPAIGPLP